MRFHMASVSLKLFLLVSASLLLGAASAQELYEDEPMLEQYSPFMGENLIDYPMLEEYGVPTLEEVPDEGPEDDDDDENENDSTETEHKDKKEVIKHTDKEHAQKTSSALNSNSDAREKRQLPLQDDPVEVAREKLQKAIKAAQALTGIEQELGLNPETVEQKTANLESELKNEETNFKKLADGVQDKTKKAKFVKLEKDADNDVNKAENILKLIVKLEAAKYLAKERAQEDLQKAERRKLASTPPMIYGKPRSYPPQAAGYFGGVQQPAYQPMIQSYMTSYQPQMFQGISPPSMTSAPSTMLSPASMAGQTSAMPPYQLPYQDDTEIQRINSIKATQASASVLPAQSSSLQTAESIEPEPDKMASFSSEGGNNDINQGHVEFNNMPNPSQPKKPAAIQPPITAPKIQSDAHVQAIQDHKEPQAPATPLQTNKETTSAVSSATVSQPAPPVAPAKPVMPAQPVVSAQPITPAQPVAPAQTILSPTQTIESVIGQSNGLMSQAAPLTAAYNPKIVAPKPLPVSRFFDSLSNSPSLFAPQPFNRPFQNPPTPLQAFVSPMKPKKTSLKGPEPVKPVAAPITAAFNDQPQSFSPPSSATLQAPAPSAYSGEQALSGAYPSNSFYSWNTQAFPSNRPQYSWNSPAFYPAPATYQAPVNPLIAEAYRKLQDTARASLAMSKIEEAIGLSPSSVKHIIDDIGSQAKQEEHKYEDDMSKEKAEINKEKLLIQKDEVADGENAKKKIEEDEAKLRDDIRKENVAKLEVDKIKKMEKILTIIEAAKYSAMQRAKNRINNLKGADEGLDGDDIRKRDLEDLEKDIRRRRRNEINIWLKGSRNRIDTSRFLRHNIGKLVKHGEERSRWDSDDKKLLDHSQNEKIRESAVDGLPKESRLHKLKFFRTLVSNKKLDSAGNSLAVEKRTGVPEKPKKSADAFIMSKLLEKVDKLYKIQEDILKYLKTEHDIHQLQKKTPARRLRRSLHYSKHHKNEKRNKRKAH